MVLMNMSLKLYLIVGSGPRACRIFPRRAVCVITDYRTHKQSQTNECGSTYDISVQPINATCDVSDCAGTTKKNVEPDARGIPVGLLYNINSYFAVTRYLKWICRRGCSRTYKCEESSTFFLDRDTTKSVAFAPRGK